MADAGFYVLLTFVILFLLSAFIFSRFCLKIVHQAEVMIIERFGRYHETLKPGLHFIIPFVDSPRNISWRYLSVPPGKDDTQVMRIDTDRIDMREHVIDFARQHVISADNVSIDIDALVYYTVTDAKAVVYNIANAPDAIELLTQATLRNIIAQLTLDDCFSSREHINSMLKERTQRDAERWGVSIIRVELMNLHPPADIRRAMEKQIREERERRSTVLNADGDRESAVVRSHGDAAREILNAEGFKASRINTAKGEAEAKLLTSNAEAQAISILRESMADTGIKASDYLVGLQYVNSLKSIATGKTNVTLIPAESLDFVKAATAKKAD